MKQFFDKFDGLKGSKFIGIKKYTNKYGEIANINLLVNINTTNAKEKDLQTLKSVNDVDLKDISIASNLPIDVLNIALSELIASGEKNLSKEMSERTNQSQAQADAYIHLTPSIRLHKDSMNVFISGFINSKTVLVEGIYPNKNKREKTKCKDAITKHCDLRMSNYRQYKVGEMDKINITGSTLQM